MKLRIQRIVSALLALVAAAALLPRWAQAADAGRIDTAAETSLCVEFLIEDGGAKTPAPDVWFMLYRVADVSAAGTFTLSGDFADYPVSLGAAETGQWSDRAATLAAFAQLDAITPLRSGKTDRNGKLTFTGLETGLYLVVGEPYTAGNTTYTTEPFLISLPNLSGDTAAWVYDVTASPKYTGKTSGTPGEETVDIRVRKSWDDALSTSSRPKSVRVTLLRNGKEYETVTLNAEGNWRYTWRGLDAADRWTVVERPVPDGYTVLVSKTVTDGSIIFLVTNTSKTTGPTTPTTPTSPTTPSTPGGSGTTGGTTRPGGSSGGSLPQTGALWWPVPVGMMAGLALIVAGLVRRRADDA